MQSTFFKVEQSVHESANQRQRIHGQQEIRRYQERHFTPPDDNFPEFGIKLTTMKIQYISTKPPVIVHSDSAFAHSEKLVHRSYSMISHFDIISFSMIDTFIKLYTNYFYYTLLIPEDVRVAKRNYAFTTGDFINEWPCM